MLISRGERRVASLDSHWTDFTAERKHRERKGKRETANLHFSLS